MKPVLQSEIPPAPKEKTIRRFKPLSFLVRMIALALFIAPFCLNQIWYVGGGDWLYWFSSYLCYSQILYVGLLAVLVPRQFRAWLHRDPWTGSSEGRPENWNKLKYWGMVFFGVVFIIIGLSSLLVTTVQVLRGCAPLSNCF